MTEVVWTEIEQEFNIPYNLATRSSRDLSPNKFPGFTPGTGPAIAAAVRFISNSFTEAGINYRIRQELQSGHVAEITERILPPTGRIGVLACAVINIFRMGELDGASLAGCFLVSGRRPFTSPQTALRCYNETDHMEPGGPGQTKRRFFWGTRQEV